ncbi:MAG TPA: glycine cleavage system protein GcvH [Candidatus Methanoperedens sp.]|nr:glycine cleavage system protein GcvH [Candidatus Methanoperedens sp.]
MQFPAGLKYTKEHVWVRHEGAEAIVGITDHAQKELGDIVFVETPQPGAALTRGRPFGVVESVKSVSDLYAPIGGTVARVNAALASTPEVVNKDPYGAGWMIALAPADPAEIAGLLDAAAYEALVREVAG